MVDDNLHQVKFLHIFQLLKIPVKQSNMWRSFGHSTPQQVPAMLIDVRSIILLLVKGVELMKASYQQQWNFRTEAK